jgi:sulfotransferase family protein
VTILPYVSRPPAPMPVIVGAARSGTTLLRLMLDAHPELAIPPETHFVPDVAELGSTGPDLRYAFLHVLVTARTWHDMRISDDELAAALEDVEPFTVSGGLRAFYALYAARQGKARWGDKTPMYVRRLADVERVLPEARFVHLIRDGRDVALSARDTWAGRDSPIPAQARRWRKDVKRGRSSGRRRAHYLEVRYEALVRDSEQALRRVCAFCGLRYADDMLRYHESAEARLSELGDKVLAGGRRARREDRLAIHARTGSPPQPQRAGRWRREMSADDLAEFEAVAGALLDDLGYELGARTPS